MQEEMCLALYSLPPVHTYNENTTNNNRGNWNTTSSVFCARLHCLHTFINCVGGNQFMSDTGWKSPGTNSHHSGNAWTTPENVYSTDETYAISPEGTNGDWESYGGFGFSIPSGATINGIELTVTGHHTHSSSINYTVQFRVSGNDGTSYSSSKGVPSWAQGTTDKTSILGGSSDLWGLEWTADSFSNTNFRVIMGNQYSIIQAYVNSFQIKVYYTESSGTPTVGTKYALPPFRVV